MLERNNMIKVYTNTSKWGVSCHEFSDYDMEKAMSYGWNRTGKGDVLITKDDQIVYDWSEENVKRICNAAVTERVRDIALEKWRATHKTATDAYVHWHDVCLEVEAIRGIGLNTEALEKLMAQAEKVWSEACELRAFAAAELHRLGMEPSYD